MQVFAPGIGKRINLSAREKREYMKRLLTGSHDCFPEPPMAGMFVNERKHFEKKQAEENRVAEENRKKESEEAAKKKRLVPAWLREARAHGEKLSLKETLMADYDVEEGVLLHPMTELSRLRSLLGGEFLSSSNECLNGKKILDLACGSKEGCGDAGIFGKKGTFEAWLCRALQMCGAKAIGVDIGSNDGELFEHYCADLSEKGVLAKLFNEEHDSSFDAIHVVMFCEGNLSPWLKSMTTPEERLQMKAGFFEETARLLKEGGWLLYEDDIYRKTDGKVILVRETR